MFRNENDLLKSLRKVVRNYDWFNTNDVKEEIKPLSKRELQELESYRDNDGLLNFTKIKDMDLLSRLVNNVERKNALEEKTIEEKTATNSTQDYVATLIDELLPLMGIKEANFSVDTPAGKAKINVKKGEEPKVVYEMPEKSCTDTTLTYTVKNEDESETVLDVTKTVPVVEEEKLPFEDDITLSETLGTCEGLIDLDICEPKAKTVRLYDAPGVHNPQYYHAVKYICEELLFPFDNVYSYEDEDAPRVPDVMVILPNVWGKISSFDLEFFETMMMENENITTYILDPETFELKNIDSIFDLNDYVMTTQQEETLY